MSGRPPATPATHKKRDPGLEETIGDIRARVGRRRNGRIAVTIELVDGDVTGHRVEESAMTEEDYERLMQEPPRAPRSSEGRVLRAK